MRPLYLPVMWEITSATLHCAARSLHVDPEEVFEEGLFEVVVDACVVHDGHELVDGEDRLAHRLDEAILPLPTIQRMSGYHRRRHT